MITNEFNNLAGGYHTSNHSLYQFSDNQESTPVKFIKILNFVKLKKLVRNYI